MLRTVPVRKGGESVAVARRGWILLTAYRRMCQRVNTLIEEKCHLEKEKTDSQGRLAMLQCQDYILGDQARGYHTAAEKAAVQI